MARFRIFSGVSKFSFIAILGLIVSLVEHLVGFSTNYWVVKEINVGVYYCQGLWRECYCHTYCACVYIDKYPEDGIFSFFSIYGKAKVKRFCAF